jgi:hypothetical protein
MQGKFPGIWRTDPSAVLMLGAFAHLLRPGQAVAAQAMLIEVDPCGTATPVCAQARMTLPLFVIELDGGQHLGDPDAYRRDCRKDALLQENGYLVLRFLAEDVGKYLHQVLDAILRGFVASGG